jgi:type IV pilus assembly protein PilB
VSEQPSHLRAVEASYDEAQAARANGVTHPQRRGGLGRFLTDVLVELGFTDHARVQRAIGEARSRGIPPEQLLLEERAITSEQLSHAIAERYGLDHLELGIFKVDMAAANLLSASAAKRYGAVPVAYLDDHTLLVAMSDPANVLAVDDITLLTRLDVKPAVASADDISALIARMNRFEDAVQEAVQEGEDGASPLEIVDLRESAEDAPVIKLVHSIIAQAAERGVSDIHARGPGHPDGRRDPGSGDRADRHRGCAHRSHGALDAPHQRRCLVDHPADRDGGRAVPGRLRDRLRGRAAAGSHPLP